MLQGNIRGVQSSILSAWMLPKPHAFVQGVILVQFLVNTNGTAEDFGH